MKKPEAPKATPLTADQKVLVGKLKKIGIFGLAPLTSYRKALIAAGKDKSKYDKLIVKKATAKIAKQLDIKNFADFQKVVKLINEIGYTRLMSLVI